MNNILANLDLDIERPEKNSKLVLVISLVTSVARDLHFSWFRLIALKLLVRLAKHVTAEIILDRILPYILWFAQDPLPEVRAETIRAVTASVRNLRSVPRNDGNVFQDYIIPALAACASLPDSGPQSHLLGDPVLQVRLTFAENIAELADIAVKYLDMAQAAEIREVIVQLKDQQRDKASISETVHTVKKSADELKPEIHQVESNYDMELQQLKDLIQQKIFQLLSDPNHAVKMTLMANGMDKLCLFFGRQKANDILLSHIVTFLNVKDDWRLRACFFKTVVDVTMYVGWQCSEVLLPLLQQGLSDTEEFVITEDLHALKQLTNHRLLTKTMMQTLVCDAAALLAHPGPWVRQAAVGFVTAVAQAYDIPDIHCKLLPQVRPFLSRNIMQLRKPAMKDFMIRLHKNRSGSTEQTQKGSIPTTHGSVNIALFGRSVTRRHADLQRQKELTADTQGSSGKSKKLKKQDSVQMNPEWKKMFGSDEPDPSGLSPSLGTDGRQQLETSVRTGGTTSTASSTSPGSPVSGSSDVLPVLSSDSFQRALSVTHGLDKHHKTVITRYAKCKWELRDLVHHKRAQFERDLLATVDSLSWGNEAGSGALYLPPDTWRPKGVLVAHLQEHRGAIN
ncbi:phosphoinositide 3-kinase regulatory subunit 4, partial [Elysia marginata]